MKKLIQFTLLFCAICAFFTGTAVAQIGPGGGSVGNDCFNPKQVCPSCPCLMIYDPVCGCDGQTYSNSCFAYNAGITRWKEGACPIYSSAQQENEDTPVFFSPVVREILYAASMRRAGWSLYPSMAG